MGTKNFVIDGDFCSLTISKDRGGYDEIALGPVEHPRTGCFVPLWELPDDIENKPPTDRLEDQLQWLIDHRELVRQSMEPKAFMDRVMRF